MAEQEEPESEPKADAIRGAAAIIRRISQSRQKMEAEEARRVHEMRIQDQMETIGENEQVEWDGLRRRKTIIDPESKDGQRRKTLHPPLGMAHFPNEDDAPDDRPSSSDVFGSGGMRGGFFNSFRRRGTSKFTARQGKSLSTGTPALTEPVSPSQDDTPPTAQVLGAMEMDHVYGLPPSLRGGDASTDNPHFDASTEYTGAGGKPIMWADSVETRPSSSRGSDGNLAPPPPPHGGGTAKRQFSFTNPFHRNRKSSPPPESSSDSHHRRPSSRLGLGSRGSSRERAIPGIKTATEEERLGLVKGDSRNVLEVPGLEEEEDDGWQLEGGSESSGDKRRGHIPLIREEKESESSGRSSPDFNAPRTRQPDLDDDYDDDDGGQPPLYSGWQGQHGRPSGSGSLGSGKPAFL